ncbi:MAG: hypothetical protein [Caudoviricetes sp.]|nr:MAG: hypothetical protein [Caudoviricetes sp.]
MATLKALKIKAMEYFAAGNFLDLEDVMLTLAEKHPKAHAKLVQEFDEALALEIEMEVMGDDEWFLTHSE